MVGRPDRRGNNGRGEGGAAEGRGDDAPPARRGPAVLFVGGALWYSERDREGGRVRTSSDVHNYLLEQGVAHEIVHLPALSSTARRNADLLGVPLREVLKTVLFETERGPVVCLVRGDARIDHARVCTEFGCASVTAVVAARVVSLTGYRPRSLPPCGLASDLPVVADAAIFELPVVYCGGGSATTMVKLRSAELRDALGVRVAAIAQRLQNGAVARG